MALPASSGRNMSAAIEYIRPAVPADEFVALVREANDKLDDALADVSQEQDGHPMAKTTTDPSSSAA